MSHERPEYGDKEYVSPREIDEAYAMAEKVLANPILLEDFPNYRDGEADQAYVDRLKEKFKRDAEGASPEEKESAKLGRIFEAIVFQQIEQSNWLGESTTTIQPSEYDDVVNKVDCIVEIEESPTSTSHLALAMDVTISGHFGDKFAHIKESIDLGELTKIKYFATEAGNFKGEKSMIPSVVIAIDRKTLLDLVQVWIHKDQKALAEHPAQVKILEEIRVQLEAFAQYAESVNKPKLVEVYRHSLAIIENIIAEKEITEEQFVEAREDAFLDAITFNAEHLADRK